MAGLAGTWKAGNTDDVESVIAKLSADCEMRKLLLSAKPTYTFIPIGDDGMKVRVDSDTKNSEVSFKFNEEVDEETASGKICKNMYRKISDNEVIQTQRLPEGIVEIDRMVNGDTMTTTVYVADAKCTQTFHRA